MILGSKVQGQLLGLNFLVEMGCCPFKTTLCLNFRSFDVKNLFKTFQHCIVLQLKFDVCLFRSTEMKNYRKLSLTKTLFQCTCFSLQCGVFVPQ